MKHFGRYLTIFALTFALSFRARSAEPVVKLSVDAKRERFPGPVSDETKPDLLSQIIEAHAR